MPSPEATQLLEARRGPLSSVTLPRATVRWAKGAATRRKPACGSLDALSDGVPDEVGRGDFVLKLEDLVHERGAIGVGPGDLGLKLDVLFAQQHDHPRNSTG